jgi:hypothetical protein
MKFQATTSDKKGKTTGNLHVLFKETKNLPTLDCNIKCSLSNIAGKKKSSSPDDQRKVMNCESLPTYNEMVFQKLKLHELVTEKALEVGLWDGSEQLLGRLRLGPTLGRGKGKESTGEGRHWESIMANLGEWQEAWHTLRIN